MLGNFWIYMTYKIYRATEDKIIYTYMLNKYPLSSLVESEQHKQGKIHVKSTTKQNWGNQACLNKYPLSSPIESKQHKQSKIHVKNTTNKIDRIKLKLHLILKQAKGVTDLLKLNKIFFCIYDEVTGLW